VNQSPGRQPPQTIRPADFKPPRERGHRFRLSGIALWLLLPLIGAFVAALLWYVFTLRAVAVSIVPEPQSISVSGLTMIWGQRLLARPGDYQLRAEKPGYAPLSTAITIPKDGDVRLEFELQPLPGRVEIRSLPVPAEVSINDELAGVTPLTDVLLEGGSYQLLFQAEGYQPLQQDLEVAGLDEAQVVEVTMLPQAQVSFSSSPADAAISIDGVQLARTPATLGLNAGTHAVTISKAGYQPWSDSIEVSGSEPLNLEQVKLLPAPASVRITSEPNLVTVRINGQVRGRTPLTAEVEPDTKVTIVLSHPGYQDLRNEISIPANTEKSLKGILTPILGEIAISADPPDTRLLIDGKAAGNANQLLKLPAVATELVFRKPGYVEQKRTVTPDPARRQDLQIKLETELQARLQNYPQMIEAGSGQRLRLIMPGRFVMGAPRGQQGRRANEFQRQVELTRPYYIAEREVTNAQFRAFKASHSSGIVGDKTLDFDQQPVVRVSWQEAAAYSNWLSQQDGLTPAYQNVAGKLELVQPVTNGYRLPSEAEWAWMARFAGNRKLKYPWGESMPPGDSAGNYADLTARELMQTAMPNYEDGWAAAAPVGAFRANELGLYDVGGNVSEWTNDYYSTGLNAAAALERDPLGPATGNTHVVRGASWRHASITELRLSWRDEDNAGRDDLGFRLARYPE
jgi:formylglycine-generating enzyme required for sulfatase activity